MIALPPHLTPWSTHLALFPRDIALALGAMVSRLSSILGSGPPWHATEGPPDGYDGITNRGPYDRLLPAEWMLLDEVPDEFLRRVIAGEHSFLRRGHARQTSFRRCMVLFDAGAEQLGGPRIAHLALLIVLARRAERQRATLHWGVLQDTTAQPSDVVTNATVRAFLEARCFRGASAQDVERWLSAERGPAIPELWLIGAPNVVGYATSHRASTVVVEEILEVGSARRLSVRASSARLDGAREAVLDLPPYPLAVRLLRDPFGQAAVARQVHAVEIDVRSNLLFSPDARLLYVRGAQSTLISFHVPNSPRAAPGPPAIFAAPKGHTIVGVGRSSPWRRTLVLTQQGNEAFVHLLSKRGASSNRSERFMLGEGVSAVVTGSNELAPLAWLKDGHYCFIADDGDLVELSHGHAIVRAKAAAMGARALRDGLAWASLHQGTPQVLWTRANSKGEMENTPMTKAPGQPLYRGPFHFGSGSGELFAYRDMNGDWVVVDQRQFFRATWGGCDPVVGVVQPPGTSHDIYLDIELVQLTPERTRLYLRGRSNQTIASTTAPIAHVELSGKGSMIAFLTEGGEIGVYSCAAKALVMRASAGVVP